MNGLGWFVSGGTHSWRKIFTSYSESLPDFVKLADTFGMTGLVAETASGLDDV